MTSLFVVFLALLVFWGVHFAQVTSDPYCYKMEWYGSQYKGDGWHGQYKCFNGNVIEYRER